MGVKSKNYRLGTHFKSAPSIAAAAAIFSVALMAPVTPSLDTGLEITIAHAAKDGKGGTGNGKGGKSGGGDSGGTGGGGRDTGGRDGNTGGASADRGGDDRYLLLLPQQEVAMAMFTTRISKRYPADDIKLLNDPHQAVSFFSELKSMAGKKISHHWYYGDELKFQTSFKISADSWRIWSTQLLPEDMAGEWSVRIIDDGSGEILETRVLNYVPDEAKTLAHR